MKSNHDKPRIWHMDCLSICAVLGLGLGADELDRVLLPHACPHLARHLAENRGMMLHFAHKAAHQENVFSRAVCRLLDDKYREEIGSVSHASVDMLRERLCSVSLESIELPGILWGLLTDRCERKRALGVSLVHDYVQRGFSTIRPRVVERPLDVPESIEPDLVDLSIPELRARVTEQSVTIERMLNFIRRTRPESAAALVEQGLA